MKTLLLIDLQNDFLPEGSMAVREGNVIIPLINKLEKNFECILATKDWHPSNHISFAKTHEKKPGDTIYFQGRKQELWPVHCVQNSHGAEFSPLLQTSQIEKVFYKGMDPKIDSYSAFFDNAHLHSTGLGEYLKEKGTREIYLVGLATDYCVKYSTLDALQLAIATHVIIDACAGINLHPYDSHKAIEQMRDAGAKIVFSKDVFSKASL